MKVLVVGAGGREHALCWKFRQSEKINRVYCAPGNGGTGLCAENADIPADDFEGLARFVRDKGIDFTFVGPEAPLVSGIVDFFEKKGLKIFGPNKKAARLEGSKTFSKDFMTRHGIATALYDSFDNFDHAAKFAAGWSENKRLVIKADGLAAGKGVFVCRGRDDAVAAVRQIMADKVFGNAGGRIVAEEFLDGREVSVLLFTDGKSFSIMPPAQDHKRALDNDMGLNTGGMGAYAPAPIADKDLMEKIKTCVADKVMSGFAKDGIAYKGVLYMGIMEVKGKPYVLEFNARLGDPETQVILPLLKTDLTDISFAVMDGRLEDMNIEWRGGAAVSVVLASGGYPGKFEIGHEISGLENLSADCIAFHSGTKADNGKILTAGGRVLNITSVSDDIWGAARDAYENVKRIKFKNMHYRTDIAKKAFER